MPVAKEQIRQIISENNISCVTDVYTLLRDSFKDILQELLEAEMDALVLAWDAERPEKPRGKGRAVSIQRINQAMKEVEADHMDYRIDCKQARSRETYYMAASFNHMIQQIPHAAPPTESA